MLFKKKDKNETLKMVDDYKEPFSLRDWWEDHIIDGWKRFKKTLDDRGIIFFFISPFQYRNRLLIKLWLIVFGVIIGIVPRTFELIETAKFQSSQSELYAVLNRSFKSGLITITPLAASHENGSHVMVYQIDGDTQNGVPSTTDAYDVSVTEKYNVEDIEKMVFKYQIIPYTATQRFLVVYVDNNAQGDFRGTYDLTVKIKDDASATATNIDTIEFTVGELQPTTDLFKNGLISLYPISNALEGKTNDTIEKTDSELKELLKAYKLNEDRLRETDMSVIISSDELNKRVDEALQYITINDQSTTESLIGLGITSEVKVDTLIPWSNGVVFEGTTYIMTQSNNVTIQLVKDELGTLNRGMDAIISRINTLNQSRVSKINRLLQMSRVLNKPVDPTRFVDGQIIE